jgi:hypothetical protein
MNRKEEEKHVPLVANLFLFPYNLPQWLLMAPTLKSGCYELLCLIHLASPTLNFNCAKRSPTQNSNIKSHGNASNMERTKKNIR